MFLNSARLILSPWKREGGGCPCLLLCAWQTLPGPTWASQSRGQHRGWFFSTRWRVRFQPNRFKCLFLFWLVCLTPRKPRPLASLLPCMLAASDNVTCVELRVKHASQPVGRGFQSVVLITLCSFANYRCLGRSRHSCVPLKVLTQRLVGKQAMTRLYEWVCWLTFQLC